MAEAQIGGGELLLRPPEADMDIDQDAFAGQNIEQGRGGHTGLRGWELDQLDIEYA